MKKLNLIRAVINSFVCLLSCGSSYAQTSAPVRITAWGMHYGGQVMYRYQVQNLGSEPIKRFFIGLYQTDTGGGAAELTVFPASSNVSSWLPPNVAQRPESWGVASFFPDESAKFALEWVEAGYDKQLWPAAGQTQDSPAARTPANVIPAGKSWDSFSVTVRQPDIAYVNGHASVDYGQRALTLQLKKGDEMPPSISGSAIATKNGGMLNVEVSLNVKDNFDPNPEISLVSVTANEAFHPKDVVAAIGQDKRILRLKRNKGRIYYLTYEAVDGSGNADSVVIAVPATAD
jgi:hypothetical protein